MSVHHPGVELNWLAENAIVSNHEACFLCGEPIEGSFVYWQGSTGSIALHEGCADHLGWDLVKDAALSAAGRFYPLSNSHIEVQDGEHIAIAWKGESNESQCRSR